MKATEPGTNTCKNCGKTWQKRLGAKRRHFCSSDCRIEYRRDDVRDRINTFHARLTKLERHP